MENSLTVNNWPGRYGYFIAVFLLGTALACSYYLLQQESAEIALKASSGKDIRQAFSDVEQHISRELGTLKTMQDFIDIEPDITEAKFARMAASILDVKPYISAFSWVPLVKRENRDDFVRWARQEVIDSFHIKQFGEKNDLVKSGVYQEYFPVTYIVPKRRHLDIFGLNLLSEPRRRQALTLSGLQNLRVMTEPVQLVATGKLEPSVLIFAPIYEKKALDAKRLLKWQDLKGFVLMVLRTQEFYRHIIESAERDTNIALRIVDRETGRQLANSSQFSREMRGPTGIQQDYLINVGQRQWRITGQSISGVDKSQNLITTAAGIAISLVLGLFIQAQKRQTRLISEEVNKRTLDLKLRGDELNIANQRLELAMLNTKQGIWDWNIKTNDVYFSPSTEFLAGYRKGDWEQNQGMWSKLVREDEYAAVLEAVARHVSGETEFYVSEHRIRRKDGRYMWIRDQGRIVEWDENGNPLRMIGSHVDIDDQKAIELELIEARDAAEQAAIVKTQFLSTMSHEIRTPMNGVMGMAQLLEDTDLTQEQQEYVETINRSGNNLLKLINDILDFSKLDANKTELESIPFDLEELCVESLELFAVEAVGKKVDLIFDYDVGSFRCFYGDPSRLRQVILNLVGNAVKFTTRGFIKLTVSCQQVNNENAGLTIEIEDTGIGIPEEAVKHLFDEFTQADQATTRQFGGTGLGLAIVKKIIGLMKGDISVVSEYGKGSKFVIELDLPVVDGEVTALSQSLEGYKVLLVDGQIHGHDYLVKLLQALRLEPQVIDNPDRVVSLLTEAQETESPFDLVIVDHEMKTTSGRELGGEIRKQRQLASLGLMMYSHVGRKIDVESLKGAGFNAFINNLSRRESIINELVSLLNHPETKVTSKTFPAKKQLPEDYNRPRVNAHILLAEDIRANQVVAMKFIKKFGATLDIANNGEAAVDMWQSGRYDMILMDCRMPIMDGYEATRLIRKLEQSRDGAAIPIIAFTANASTEDCELCYSAGMDDVITKPFRREELYEVFDRWLADNLLHDPEKPVKVIGA